MELNIPVRGLGLGLLPPALRLILTVMLILYVQYETRFDHVLYALLISVILLALNLVLRHKILLFTAVGSTLSFIFLGNYFFPPFECGQRQIAMLPIDTSCSVGVALFFAVRRVTMLLFGFAWLNATKTAEMADLTRRLLRPISRSYPYDVIGLFLFSIFDRMLFEYETANQSIEVRAQVRPKGNLKRLRRNVYITYLKLSAVILRILANTPKIAFAIGMHGRAPTVRASRVTVCNLSIGYEPENYVLRNVSFEVQEGELVLLKGGPGSGKTTLLRAIARYIPRITGYLQGKIVVGGQVWCPSEAELIETLPGLRMVTQDTYEFFLGLTVRQELSLQSDNIADRTRAIQVFKIEPLLDRYISTLSGGERVKVILACVLASRTSLLLLDNPLSQLDLEGRHAFISALELYLDEVKPVVIVCDHFEELFIPFATAQLTLSQGTAILNSVQSEAAKMVDDGFSAPEPAIREDSNARQPIAALQDATIEREGQDVLTHFSFHVYRSEIIGLTGTNGSGKTTAMLALAGALSLRSGTVRGSESVSISFQAPELQFVALRTRDEISVKGKLACIGSAEIEDFCLQEIDWLGLNADADVLDLRAYDARMLSISSMLQHTRVLVVDEPTTQIPSESMSVFVSRIKQLKGMGKSVVIITHASSLLKLCDRVVRL